MARQTVIIIGAGLVGLATAYQLQRRNPRLRIAVLEKEGGPAMHQSGHNSGVIHSGIYYKPGSLKATNCIRGYQYLLEFCRQHQVPFRICGKLIVATDVGEVQRLTFLQERAAKNGLFGVQFLDATAAKEKEPYVNAKAALWVPHTGVVDFRSVANVLVSNLRQSGVELTFGRHVKGISQSGNGIFVITDQQDYRADYLINCAGLHSDVMARMTGLRLQHKIIPFRGEYWLLSEEAAKKVNGLVYPVPHPDLPFLGVHLTRMMDDKVEAGPNAVLALKKEGYKSGDFSLREGLSILGYPGLWKMGLHYIGTGASEVFRSMSKNAFLKSVQRLLPDITEDDLIAQSAGVRAQALLQNGQLLDDFLLMHAPGMTHVCNAPSPAATSCLSIGEQIAIDVLQRME